MPYRPNPRRPLPIQLNALQLTGSIALGLWLGFIAIALTFWLVSRLFFSEQMAPVAAAVEQLTKPAVVAQPAPDIPPQSPIFQQYEENLRKNEQAQRLDQARSSNRNLSNAKCQFWLQQDQNAPSEKSRANVLQFCD
jgi:small-conductance mechanosensitive channel